MDVLEAKETCRQHTNLDARVARATIRPVRTEPCGAVTTKTPPTSNTRAPRPATKQVEAVIPSVKHTMKKNNGKEKITSTKGKKPCKRATVQSLESIHVTARIEQLKKDLRKLQRSTKALLRQTRNVLLHNFSEPTIRDTKARREADRQHVQNVF
ncbi:unnamed protein product [Echinostoma caproni]|uniref:Nbl1_Borealin_N domain-containing protein n=1 Tax=Echinostoma caproni TaxID=27848 RepID=A0A183AMH0_9TREM|nr:unnamed protein product [Echinostoma caproni]